jgi:ring-1,2-phenylacetyl-CoA epoxidase subunit PaaE
MSSKHIHLVVKEIIEETKDTKTISFWQPQHQSITYKAGQFLTLIPEINGKKPRRSYSMSSSPREGALSVTVKRLEHGEVSNYLCDNLKVGDAIEALEPMGHFVLEPHSDNRRNVVLFAGGSGITPIMSMIKSVLPVEPNSKVYLVYGSRDEENIIFKKQLDDLELQYQGRFQVLHVLSKPSYTWIGYKTRINQASTVTFLKQNFAIDIPSAHYYMCGPEGMMEQVENALKLFDVPVDNIHKEHFTASHSTTNVLDEKEEDQGLVQQTVEIRYEGESYQVVVKPHESILEAALKLDIDLPYSCQAGMCTACMGKCIEGKIMMDDEDGLTEKEIKDGFLLTCVAHPMSAGVIIEVE